MSITVGQTLVYAPSDPRRQKPSEVVVERVGRKWVYLAQNAGRVDIDTLLLDGGIYSSPGRCYGSWAEYEETTALSKAWNQLWLAVKDRYARPDGVTIDDIREAARLLRLRIQEDVK